MRGLYKTGASAWTFTDYSLPYTGTAGAPTFLDTDTYTLSTFAAGDFVNYWVYATNDIGKPIYIVPSHRAAALTTLANARVETAPDLSTFGASAEMKLIYRFIYNGAGQFQESADYRQVSSLPSGGTASTTAGAVSFVPSGNIAATTVQTAIEELDTEKAPLASPTFTGTVILPKTLEIQDTSADHQYVLGVSELTADRTVTLPLLTGNDEFVFKDHTQTLTNKRVTKRSGTTTSSATPTINTDNYDFYSLTAQTEAITSFTTNLSGTPTEGQKLWIAITGTAARAITWGTSFEAGAVALPTTTVTTARLDVGFVWNTVTSKWRCMASG
jgi:hypothetical protein